MHCFAFPLFSRIFELEPYTIHVIKSLTLWDTQNNNCLTIS